MGRDGLRPVSSQTAVIAASRLVGVVYQKQSGNVKSCTENLITGSVFQGCCTVYYIQKIFIFHCEEVITFREVGLS